MLEPPALEPPAFGDPPVLRRLREREDPAFAAFLKVYAEAIPLRERKSAAAMAELLNRDAYHLMVLEADDRVLGIGVIFIPEGRPFFLLEYLAVTPEARNRGLGTRLFQANLVEGRRQSPGAWCLVEVDAVGDGAGDNASSVRRQSFYRRQGCLRMAGLNYLLPLLGEGEPLPMDLFVHPPEEAAHGVSRAVLADWLAVVYADVYGRPPEDPRLRRMLEPLEHDIRLV